ncbi:MAG: hypothetical protein AAFV19_18945 [Pseudomonadota bacterium]
MGSLRRAATLAGAILFSMTVGGPDAALAQSDTRCGTFHRVAAGDTLRQITMRTYGHDTFQLVFKANRDVLSDPSRIEVGQLLYLPCPGTGAQTRREALAAGSIRPSLTDDLGSREAERRERLGLAQPSGTASTAQQESQTPRETPTDLARAPQEPATPPEDVTVRKPGTRAIALAGGGAPPDPQSEYLLLSGSGFAPLVDETLPEGGLAALLLKRALAENPEGRAVRVGFVNDWKSHLRLLMPTGAFSLAFPWPAPVCSGAVSGPVTEHMCAEFLFSRPLYEVPVQVWGRAGDPLLGVRTLAEMAGRRICRPRTFPPVDLEAVDGQIIVVQGKNIADCAGLLRSGDVDMISAPLPHVQKAAMDPELWGGFAEIAALRSTASVHALAWRHHDEAGETIAAVDAGLMRLQSSGEWFGIVAKYLGDYNQTR